MDEGSGNRPDNSHSSTWALAQRSSLWGRRPFRLLIYFALLSAWVLSWYYLSTGLQHRLRTSDIRDWKEFCEFVWTNGVDKTTYGVSSTPSPSRRLWALLPPAVRTQITNMAHGEAPPDDLPEQLTEHLNETIRRPDFYDETDFRAVKLSNESSVFRRAAFRGHFEKLNYAMFQAAFENHVTSLAERRVFEASRAVLIASLLSGVLPFLVAFLAFELNEKHSRALGRRTAKHTAQLTRVEQLVTSVREDADRLHETVDEFSALVGLERYIEASAIIYSEPDTERVVTSLKHWVATGESAEHIERGLREAPHADRYYFVGTIHWDRFFPGVMWRFLAVRRFIGTKGKIIHVDEDVPLFVVSKRRAQAGADVRPGSLLVGNRRSSRSTKVYGVNLGKADPYQVEHYNFVFDTLIWPDASLAKGALAEVLAVTRTRAHVAKDGIRRLFEDLPQFKKEPVGLIYLVVERRSTEDDRVRLCTVIGRRIVEQIEEEVTDLSEEERSWLMPKIAAEDVARDFLDSLIETGFLVIVRSDEDGTIRFRRGSVFDAGNTPTCKDYFAGAQGQPEESKQDGKEDGKQTT